MNNNIGSARDSFNSEAEAVKNIIYEMINTENYEAAQQILEQYILINSSDPEIDEIRKILAPTSDKHEKVGTIADDHSILRGIKTVFVLNRLIFGRVGTCDSVFRKVKLMEDVWSYTPSILTCYHNIEENKIKLWLQTADDGGVTISANTEIINVYDHFQKAYAKGLDNKAVYEKLDKHMRYVEVEDNVYDVYDGDTLIKQEHFTGYLGSLRMVCNYSAGKKATELIYDDMGYLNCVREFNDNKNSSYKISYYKTDGLLWMESFYSREETDIEEPEKMIIYDEKGCIVKEFYDRSELAVMCLEQIMPKEKLCMIVIENGLLSKIATSISADVTNFAFCEVVHSVFQRDPYNPKSKSQSFYRHLCENYPAFDGVVMLTDDAKKDFINQYGDNQNVFVIPHFYPYDIDKVDFNSRDRKKAVIIARLDPLKQIDHAINIFSLVVKKVPDANLEIYGRGDEEEALRSYIHELGVENNVFLMGFTDDPISILKTASLFIMTSLAEGYGMTLAESICNGCPAFSYDLKYGPSEIINDGKTGFLFDRFDRDGFASKIVEYFNDSELQRVMSENCYADAVKFSSSEFLTGWYDMTTAIYDRRCRVFLP